jgi:hypothetical protein
MELNFVSMRGDAVDEAREIRIVSPRILPGNSDNETEYQYSIYISHQRDGIGFFGSEYPGDDSTGRLHVLRLHPAQIVESVLRIKAKIAPHADGLKFLKDFSYGLICGNKTDKYLKEHVTFIVIVHPDSLRAKEIDFNSSRERFFGHELILAEIELNSKVMKEA